MRWFSLSCCSALSGRPPIDSRRLRDPTFVSTITSTCFLPDSSFSSWYIQWPSSSFWNFSSLVTTFRASSFADNPGRPESDWESAVDPSRMMVTIRIAGLCIRFKANGGISAQHILSRRCMWPFPSVRRTLRTARRSAALSQPFRSSRFDYRTTCTQKADQNRALPRQIGKDCLLTSSMCYKELVKRANVFPTNGVTVGETSDWREPCRTLETFLSDGCRSFVRPSSSHLTTASGARAKFSDDTAQILRLYLWPKSVAQSSGLYANPYQAPRPLPCSTRWPFSRSWRKCCLSVFRLVPVSVTISPMVTRPCSRAYSRIFKDNSGMADRTIFSLSTFLASRFICC